MAMRPAQPGDVLLVVHEFTARSGDELSLAKGDRIELIERDDDFGDGWFLGRHIQNGSSGLFPEVYTTLAPKSTGIATNNQNNAQARAPITMATHFTTEAPTMSGFSFPRGGQSSFSNARTSATPPPANAFASGYVAPPISSQIMQPSMSQFSGPLKDESSVPAFARPGGQNSTMIDETMNVINEHITSMHKPNLTIPMNIDRRPSNDSSSQYSGGMGRRMSFLNGDGSSEEDARITREEVMSWTPAKVAQYLEKVGVERSHCDVFQEEEFSGEVVLGLDQSAILLQELKLGSIGRRMKTWAKIRALQEEVKPVQAVTKRPEPDSSSMAIRTNNFDRQLSSVSPTTAPSTSLVDNILSKLQSQQPYRTDPVIQSGTPSPGFQSSSMPSPGMSSQFQNQSGHRPSAASVRSLAHSRQSSLERGRGSFAPGHASPPPSHTKQGSLDRAWTMDPMMSNKVGVAPDRSFTVPVRQGLSATSSRPSSSVHLHSRSADRALERPASTVASRDDGYRTDLDHQNRREFGRPSSGDYGAVPSPTKEKKRTSAVFWQGSRPPSPEKKPEAGPVARVLSEPNANIISPTVTKLDYDTETPRAARALLNQPSSSDLPLSGGIMGAPGIMDLRKGLRTISDAITGREKAVVHNPIERPIISDPSIQETSTLGGSSTPSINSKTLDYDDVNKSDLSTPLTNQNTTVPRRKPKARTSAYTRGLLRKPPSEQIIGCDHSGWLNKKSSNLMGTWKPRLFILRGRRFSYYYSENDAEERGVIDISNHRVLPVENEFIAGIASLTGANSSNMSSQNGSPVSNFSPKSAGSTPGSVAAESPASISANRAMTFKGDNQLFIFKLVPPRTGLSKGVNFTKPTVHYFAVPSLAEGRLWMAALMKATIDRDETKSVITTYQQKTISLEKARARKERPPELKEYDGNGQVNDEEDDAIAGLREGEDDGINDDQVSRMSDEGESPTSSQRISTDGRRQSELSQFAGNARLPGEQKDDDSRRGRGWSVNSSIIGSNGRIAPQGQGLGIRGMEGRAEVAGAQRVAGTW